VHITIQVLFQPSTAGLKSSGIARLLMESIASCDEYLKPDLLSNVVLAGGPTLMKGTFANAHPP